MRRMARMGLVFGAAVLTATSAGAQEQALEWAGTLERGARLEVRGISGDVVARLASGRTAEVVATKHGRRSDFGDVAVLVFEEHGDVIVCVTYEAWRDDADCRDGHHGDHDDHDRGHRNEIHVSVDFDVLVPEGVAFDGRTVSGDVEALDLRSDVEAVTVSGDVEVSTTGIAWGQTVSGNVDVEMESLDWRRLDFKTVSGDITVRVPDGLETDVDFESLSGDFDSDFDVRVTRSRDRLVGSSLEGTIGEGGRRLTFHTVSGDARLLRTGVLRR